VITCSRTPSYFLHLVSVMVSVSGGTSLGFRPELIPRIDVRRHRNEIIMRAVWDVRSSISKSKIRGSGTSLAL
jgi:hypothetical protein